jgi:hypothetical protein
MMDSIKVGSGDRILDWGVIVAAIILFAKTADVLSYFAPVLLSEILGFEAGILYGMICAVLVEGLALALHFNPRAALSSTAQIVKWLLLGISGICQIFDGFITTDSVAQMSETLKAVLSYGVPLIPLVITVMIFSIGRLPETQGPETNFNRPFGSFHPTSGNWTPDEPVAPLVPPIAQPRELGLMPSEYKPTNPNGSKKSNPTMGE